MPRGREIQHAFDAYVENTWDLNLPRTPTIQVPPEPPTYSEEDARRLDQEIDTHLQTHTASEGTVLRTLHSLEGCNPPYTPREELRIVAQCPECGGLSFIEGREIKKTESYCTECDDTHGAITFCHYCEECEETVSTTFLSW